MRRELWVASQKLRPDLSISLLLCAMLGCYFSKINLRMNDTVDSMYNIWALLCRAQGFLESKGCTFLSATSSSTISSLITNLAFSWPIPGWHCHLQKARYRTMCNICDTQMYQQDSQHHHHTYKSSCFWVTMGVKMSRWGMGWGQTFHNVSSLLFIFESYKLYYLLKFFS